MAITHHCDECGAEVEDSCPEHPSAPIVSIATPDGVEDLCSIKADAEAEGRRDEADKIEAEIRERFAKQGERDEV